MSWTRAELEGFAGRTIPDLMPSGDLRLLFVGINPGLVSAATGLHFARRGNRFYPALRLAGVIDTDDPAEGSRQLAALGIGITNLVARASARADELDASEIVQGRARIEEIVDRRRPAVVAFAGITSYRIAYGLPRATAGRQPASAMPTQVWVVPNPSGLNAHATLESLARDYGEVVTAANVV